MADKRRSFGLPLFFLLLAAEIAVLFVIYYLRGGSGDNEVRRQPPSFSQVQRLNLQSLINAKGFSCPQPPSLQYEPGRSNGVVIVAICRQANGDRRRYEIDFKGHVRPG